MTISNEETSFQDWRNLFGIFLNVPTQYLAGTLLSFFGFLYLSELEASSDLSPALADTNCIDVDKVLDLICE